MKTPLVRTAMSHAPADVPRTDAQVMERAGSSRNAENGSHLEAADAAEGHAGQVDGPGSSGNAGIGSHLAVAPVTDAAWVQIGVSGSSGNAGTGSHLARRMPQRAMQDRWKGQV